MNRSATFSATGHAQRARLPSVGRARRAILSTNPRAMRISGPLRGGLQPGGRGFSFGRYAASLRSPSLARRRP